MGVRSRGRRIRGHSGSSMAKSLEGRFCPPRGTSIRSIRGGMWDKGREERWRRGLLGKRSRWLAVEDGRMPRKAGPAVEEPGPPAEQAGLHERPWRWLDVEAGQPREEVRQTVEQARLRERPSGWLDVEAGQPREEAELPIERRRVIARGDAVARRGGPAARRGAAAARGGGAIARQGGAVAGGGWRVARRGGRTTPSRAWRASGASRPLELRSGSDDTRGSTSRTAPRGGSARGTFSSWNSRAESHGTTARLEAALSSPALLARARPRGSPHPGGPPKIVCNETASAAASPHRGHGRGEHAARPGTTPSCFGRGDC